MGVGNSALSHRRIVQRKTRCSFGGFAGAEHRGFGLHVLDFAMQLGRTVLCFKFAKLAERLLHALLRIAIAAVFATLCAVVPLIEFAPHWMQQAQAPVAVFLLICYGGKVLYDTLFYDHFRP